MSQVTPGSLPNEAQLESYKNYLKLLHLDPVSIVDRFIKFSRPTVFIEYTQKAESFASFIYILYSIAAKEGVAQDLLSAASRYHLYQPLSQLGYGTIKGIVVNLYPYPSVSIDNTYLIDNALIVGLANSDKFNDRLVPHFPWFEWLKTDPRKFVLSDTAKLIIFKIIQRLVNEK